MHSDALKESPDTPIVEHELTARRFVGRTAASAAVRRSTLCAIRTIASAVWLLATGARAFARGTARRTYGDLYLWVCNALSARINAVGILLGALPCNNMVTCCTVVQKCRREASNHGRSVVRWSRSPLPRVRWNSNIGCPILVVGCVSGCWRICQGAALHDLEGAAVRACSVAP